MTRLGTALIAGAAVLMVAGCQAGSEIASTVLGVRSDSDFPPPTNPPLDVPADRSDLPQPVTGEDAAAGRGAAYSARQILLRAGDGTGEGAPDRRTQ